MLKTILFLTALVSSIVHPCAGLHGCVLPPVPPQCLHIICKVIVVGIPPIIH